MGILRDSIGGQGRRRGRAPTPPAAAGSRGTAAPVTDPEAPADRPAGPERIVPADGRQSEAPEPSPAARQPLAGAAPGSSRFAPAGAPGPAGGSQPAGAEAPGRVAVSSTDAVPGGDRGRDDVVQPEEVAEPVVTAPQDTPLAEPAGPPPATGHELPPAAAAATPPAHLTPAPPPAGAPGAGPPSHLTAAPPPPGSAGEEARSELRRRRDALAEEVTELHWDLGGLAYEMAIRDHFRLDVLVRRAAVLQERDAELAELERLLQMEEGGIAGSCPNCAAPHSRGAVYCWQCGTALMQRSQSSTLLLKDAPTAVKDGLAPAGPSAGDRSPRSDG